MAKKGLGRGLDLLIPKTEKIKETITEDEPVVSHETSVEAEKVETREKTDSVKHNVSQASQADAGSGKEENIVTLKLSRVEPNRDQPRKTFDEESLEELSQSIKQYGVIQPIVVCKNGDYYEIIAGERRWRAAKKAGLTEIPVVIRDYQEKEKAEVSLIENIQRENLNPIEEAAAYKQLIDEYNLTQESLAARVSKSRTAIANTMRLLKLDEKVQQMVIDGKITGGHARALLAIEAPGEQIKAAEKIIHNNLNVRQTEEMVKEIIRPDKPSSGRKKTKKNAGTEYKELEKRMTEVLGTKVKIQQKEKGGGKIEVHYFSEEDLDRIYTSINSIQVEKDV